MFTAAAAPPRLLTLILLTLVSLASLNMIMPSLAHMARDFDVSYGTVSLSVSLFMAITAVLQLIVGPLSDLYGRRPVILISIALFMLASLGATLADSFVGFMLWRSLQAAVIAGNVVGRAIVRDTSSPRQATVVLGQIGMAMALGPMLAPTLGGLLDQMFGWRSSFVVMTLCGAALLWLVWADLGETNTQRSGNVRQQLSGYVMLLGNRLFWSYTSCIALSVAVFFAFLTGTPLIAVEHFGLSGTMLGAALGAPPLGFFFGNWLSARWGSRVEPGTLLMAGRVISTVALGAALLLWLAGLHSAFAFLIFMPFIGIGNGLTNPPVMAGVMSVARDLAGSASGLSGAVVIAAGAAMTALTGAILSHDGDPLTLLWLLAGTSALSLLAGLPVRRAKLDTAEA